MFSSLGHLGEGLRATMVGLCYFGDQHSRENIEAQLVLKGSTTDS